jgi:hypothetical protein
VRALCSQHAPIHDHPGRAASLADGEGSDDDIGDAAIFLDRALVANERNGLAFDPADASEAVAAKNAGIRRSEQRRESKEPVVLFAFERTGQRPERRREQPLLARLPRTIFAAPILVAPLRHADA